jgi:hypothetical protein
VKLLIINRVVIRKSANIEQLGVQFRTILISATPTPIITSIRIIILKNIIAKSVSQKKYPHRYPVVAITLMCTIIVYLGGVSW